MIYDSVHGFIHFNELERELVDALPFQRLRYIHQLGIAYLVYPGATHTRFEHSLGVMELASQIYDRLTSKYDSGENTGYWRQIVRFAALCHDLGHLPFSHVAEKALLGPEGHEQWTLQVIQSSHLAPIWNKLKLIYPGQNVVEDVIKISIGEKKLKQLGRKTSFSAWERVVCQIITGDFFGADRIDYLLRDAKCTGVSYGLFDYHQLIEMLRILPSSEDGGLELGIEENGIESCEALLLARHFMHRRVYQYASVKSYVFHLSRFMERVFKVADLDSYLNATENEIMVLLNQAAREGDIDASSLMNRRHRFKAVEVKEKIEVDIPEGSIFWEINPKPAAKTGLAFPVLRRSGAIVDASLCSDLSIPSASASWAYVAPEYETALQEQKLSLQAVSPPL
jgi:hypothetical protein